MPSHGYVSSIGICVCVCMYDFVRSRCFFSLVAVPPYSSFSADCPFNTSATKSESCHFFELYTGSGHIREIDIDLGSVGNLPTK